MPGIFRQPYQPPQRSRSYPSFALEVNAGLASGTGTAYNAIPSINTAIHDQFLTDDAAPITSPRTAEPGPGIAVVVDVESRIAILGDRLRGLSQATPVWGDSEVVYDPVARVQGRVFAALVTLEDEANGLALGFATSNPGNPTTNGHGWAVSPSSSAGDYRNVYAITPGKLVTLDDTTRPILTSQYLVIVVLNARGAVLLLSTFGTMGFATLNADDPIGIPAYPSARVVWVDDAGDASALYAYVSAFGQGGTTSVNGHAIEDVRVMDVASWSADDALATFVDRFTRADSNTVLGNGWTAGSGTWGISSNRAYLVSSSFPNYAYKDFSIADAIVSVDIRVPDDYVSGVTGWAWGLLLRRQDASNYLRLWQAGDDRISLQSWVAGGFGETIDQTGFTWTPGQTYRLSVVMKGNKYLILIDGTVPIGSWSTDTNSRFITATAHGLFSGDAGATQFWDNFTVYPLTVTLPSTPFDAGSHPDVAASGSALGTDTFTDTNGVSLDAHTAGAGGAWTEHLGNWSIQSNRAIVAAVAGANYATQDLSSSDVDLSVDVITPGSFPSDTILAGIVFRYTDASNYMYARMYRDAGTGEVEIGENVGGSLATVAKVALPLLTISTTYTLRVRVKGDLVYIFVNGEARVAHYMRSGSAVGTRHGLYRQSTDDGAVFDNWSALSTSVSTSVNAGNASGTGSAFAASINVQPNGGNASGTGSAFGSTTTVAAPIGVATGSGAAGSASVNIQPNAGLASGTGSAFNATGTTTSSSGVATGTGTAFGPSIAIETHAGQATGTGTAFAATAVGVGITNASAGLASGSGQAFGAATAIATSAGGAAGSGQAGGPSPAITVSVGLASGSGSAFNATATGVGITNASAGLASGTGSAFGVSANVAPTGGLATGTGTSYNTTATTTTASGHASGAGDAFQASANIQPNAGAASGSGAAFDATVVYAKDVDAGLASGTGTAYAVSANVAPNAGQATGTGEAFGADASAAAFTNAPADVASGTGEAFAASVNIQPTAGLASGTGQAFNPGISTIDSADAGVATGTGQAFGAAASIATSSGGAAGSGSAGGPTPAVAVNVGQATGTGSAFDATADTTADRSANAGRATGTGAAFRPSIAIGTHAGQATGTGSAKDPTGKTTSSSGHAHGNGTAFRPSASVGVHAGLASGSGSAFNAAGVQGQVALAGIATGLGGALNATVAIAVGAGFAHGRGKAFGPATRRPAPPRAIFAPLSRAGALVTGTLVIRIPVPKVDGQGVVDDDELAAELLLLT